MTVSYSITAVQIAEAREALRSAPRRERVSAAVRKGLAIIERHHKTVEMRRGRGAASGGSDPNRITSRTGNLMRSFRIFYQRGDLQGAYGSKLPRARVLEEGATIVPKSGRALAIPTRRLAVGVGQAGLWPRDWPPGVLFRPKGHRYLARRNEAGGIEVMYVLVSSVTIPPRPGLERAMKAKLAEVTKLVADSLLADVKPGRVSGAQ